MVAGSPISGSQLSGSVVSSCPVDGGAISRTSAGAPLALAAVLILVAVLVAPEQPQDQEAICQRHNGVAACRVW
jgi:hypothetical protein